MVSAGAVAYQLQRERGQSTGFLNSEGRLFTYTLAPQYVASDEMIEAYQAFLHSIPVGKVGAQVYAAALEAADSLRGIDKLRLRVSEQALTASEAANAYTKSIHQLMAIVENAKVLFVDAYAGKQLISYLSMIKAKESASLERAMGTAGFAAGTFSTPVNRNLITEISKQEVFLDEFRTHATASVIEAYDNLFSGSKPQRVTEMRNIALAYPDTGLLNDISGEDWFQTATARIN